LSHAIAGLAQASDRALFGTVVLPPTYF